MPNISSQKPTCSQLSIPYETEQKINPLMGTLKRQSNGPIQQYCDFYTGRWWVGCYSEKGPGHAAAPPSPLFAVPNVIAHPSTASVPTSYYSMWHYNYLCTLKGFRKRPRYEIRSQTGESVKAVGKPMFSPYSCTTRAFFNFSWVNFENLCYSSGDIRLEKHVLSSVGDLLVSTTEAAQAQRHRETENCEFIAMASVAGILWRPLPDITTQYITMTTNLPATPAVIGRAI